MADVQIGGGADWTDIAQAGAAIAGIVVAVGLGIVQFVLAARDKQNRIAAYLTGAVAAAEHAEAAFSDLDLEFGGWQDVPRRKIEMAPNLHYLESTEAALASLPLQDAPSPATARSILSILREVRHAGGNLRAFLSSDNDVMRMKYDQQVREVTIASRDLRNEQRRLVKISAQDRFPTDNPANSSRPS